MPAKKKTITLEQFYDRFVAFENRVALRFDQVEETIKAEIARLEERISGIEKNLEKLTGDHERLEQEYYAITQALKRIEGQLDSLTGQHKDLRADLVVLTGRVNRIEEHVFRSAG